MDEQKLTFTQRLKKQRDEAILRGEAIESRVIATHKPMQVKVLQGRYKHKQISYVIPDDAPF